MIRKLLLLAVTAVAAFAFSAAAASAVVVLNPGMYEIEGENTLALTTEAPEGNVVERLSCENLWEANIDGSGAVEIHDINFDQHQGSTADCEAIDDCPNHHWEGQIFEHYENPTTLEEHEFGITQSFCLINAGPTPGSPSQATCEIDNAEVHCEDVLVHVPTIEVSLHGELNIHGNLGLTHEPA